MLLTFTTALGANPPPFTVSVNAGPPVATMDGEFAASTNEASAGHAGLVPVPVAAAVKWKSALFAPVMVKPVESTVRAAEFRLMSVAFIVGLVVPMVTAPKFTGETSTSTVELRGTPVIGIACGLPVPLSVRVSVATLLALPGGVFAE